MSAGLLAPGDSEELRRTLRRASQVVPLAWSAGGRRFSFQAPLTRALPGGGYVVLTAEDGTRYLAQVLEREVVEHAGPSWTVELDAPESAVAGGVRQAVVAMPIRLLTGSGELLARLEQDRLSTVSDDEVFREAVLEPAPATLAAAYAAGCDTGVAELDVGRVVAGGAGRARLRADGFGRHTFLCGQSGAGKTFALGVVLERLLLETELRLVILDPNGDYVGLGDTRAPDAVDRTCAEPLDRGELDELLRRYRAAGRDVSVFSAGHEPVRLRFGDLSAHVRAAVAGLDPLGDREEFSAFARLAEGRESLTAVRDAALAGLSPEGRQIALRIDNLGVANWDVWAPAGERSVLDAIDGPGRATVIDLSSLDSPEEQALTAGTILSHLWRRRTERRPALVVVDEAHNVCPAGLAFPLQGEGRDGIVRIAGEGRKYGLHLMLVTQRPDKLEVNALTQCDNLILMRLNGAADVERLAAAFSFVPRALIAEAPTFAKGEALFAGGIVARPMRAAFERRLSPEGGGDLPASWAGGAGYTS